MAKQKREEPVAVEAQAPQKGSSCARRGCLGCVGLLALGVVFCVAAPWVLSRLQIFGQSAESAYSGAPDPFASASVQGIFEGRQIAGVKVYVLPVQGKTNNQAFVILDASRGYAGLSPTSASDTVFAQVLSDLVGRNRSENLNLERVTIEYRDESGERAVAFTSSMENINAFVGGTMSRDQFFGQVHFDITDSIGYFGLDVGEVLQELEGQ